MTSLRVLFALLLWPAIAHAAQPIALLQPGESLTYRVGWGPLGHAGEMKIAAQALPGDRPLTRVATTSATKGLVRMMYSFDGDAATIFERDSGRLLSASAITRSSKEKTHASIDFDYAKLEGKYVDHVRADRSVIVPLPASPPMDMMTALIQTRLWKLKPGESREVDVLFDDEFYHLKISAEREETVSTPSGKKNAVLLIPTMIGKPRGMFRRGGEIRVWVSTEEPCLPLRFEVKLKVGTGFAVLTDYQAPEKKPSAPASPAHASPPSPAPAPAN